MKVLSLAVLQSSWQDHYKLSFIVNYDQIWEIFKPPLMSATFMSHFESIKDPCINCCKYHNLLCILCLFISAVISTLKHGEIKHSKKMLNDANNDKHIEVDSGYGRIESRTSEQLLINRDGIMFLKGGIEELFVTLTPALIDG